MLKIVLLVIIYISWVNAMSFDKALQQVALHETVKAIEHQASINKEEAKIESSWGDPRFTIAAKNFPSSTLANDQSPMTGVEISVSQTLPLTSKYSVMHQKMLYLSDAKVYIAKDQERKLIKSVWEIVIKQRELSQKITILKENRTWIKSMLQVSNQLYTTGKISQQAILDLKIRIAELNRDISNTQYEQLQLGDKLTYYIGEEKIEFNSIPWGNIGKGLKELPDYRLKAYQKRIESLEQSLKVSKLNYIPDVKVSFGYTSRANIDGYGDFVSGAINFSMPLSHQKDGQYAKVIQARQQLQAEFKAYTRQKLRENRLLNHAIEKLNKELVILSEMIIFSKNSRDITATSYATGNSSYVELLQSELKLQNILLHKVELESKRDALHVLLYYIQGGA